MNPSAASSVGRAVSCKYLCCRSWTEHWVLISIYKALEELRCWISTYTRWRTNPSLEQGDRKVTGRQVRGASAILLRALQNSGFLRYLPAGPDSNTRSWPCPCRRAAGILGPHLRTGSSAICLARRRQALQNLGLNAGSTACTSLEFQLAVSSPQCPIVPELQFEDVPDSKPSESLYALTSTAPPQSQS